MERVFTKSFMVERAIFNALPRVACSTSVEERETERKMSKQTLTCRPGVASTPDSGPIWAHLCAAAWSGTTTFAAVCTRRVDHVNGVGGQTVRRALGLVVLEPAALLPKPLADKILHCIVVSKEAHAGLVGEVLEARQSSTLCRHGRSALACLLKQRGHAGRPE
jgi:hypothetical protein